MQSGSWPMPAKSPHLDNAHLNNCQVLVAATGDDKANLVASLLAKD
jgi:Trk K+ transport system NAD-binding subunit